MNITSSYLKIPITPQYYNTEESSQIPPDQWVSLIDRFKTKLGEEVAAVRMTDRLVDLPVRLVDPTGSAPQEIQRVYLYLGTDINLPRIILGPNPGHPILMKLNSLNNADECSALVIQQIFEDALLIEGLHPKPARMIDRIQPLLEITIR